MNQIKRIERDPIGLDEKTGIYFHEDELQNVYDDNNNALLCSTCDRQAKVDDEGYFYCVNGCQEGYEIGAPFKRDSDESK